LLPLSFLSFGTIVAVVWFGVRLSISGRNECGAINFICTLFYFVGASFGGIARIICNSSDWSYRACFELLEKLEKINSEKIPPLEKIRGNLLLKCWLLVILQERDKSIEGR
jgi:hypothetical protein